MCSSFNHYPNGERVESRINLTRFVEIDWSFNHYPNGERVESMEIDWSQYRD